MDGKSDKSITPMYIYEVKNCRAKPYFLEIDAKEFRGKEQ